MPHSDPLQELARTLGMSAQDVHETLRREVGRAPKPLREEQPKPQEKKR